MPSFYVEYYESSAVLRILLRRSAMQTLMPSITAAAQTQPKPTE